MSVLLTMQEWPCQMLTAAATLQWVVLARLHDVVAWLGCYLKVLHLPVRKLTSFNNESVHIAMITRTLEMILLEALQISGRT